VNQRPRIRPIELFFGFAQLGAMSFGGAMTIARRFLVEERRWLDAAEFNDVLGLGQVLPGPNVVNASVIIGAKEAGPLGAVAALSGILLPPLAIVLTLAAVLGRFADVAFVRHALHGSALAGSGLIVAAGLSMASRLRGNRLGIFLAACALVLLAIVRWPLPLIIAVLVPLGIGLVLVFARKAPSA
jgi:chromate transporter